jgi:hypothetical protein
MQVRGLHDGSRIYCPNSVLKTRAGWDSGSWRISDAAFDLCLQIDDGIANRLRAANRDIAVSGFVEQLGRVGHSGTARLTAAGGTPQPASAAFIMWTRRDSRVGVPPRSRTPVERRQKDLRLVLKETDLIKTSARAHQQSDWDCCQLTGTIS